MIPSERPVTGSGEGIYQELSLDDVRPNDRQPRQQFDEEALVSLANSIRELGVLQPVLVRVAGDGFELIAGERRLRAARRAGLATIPAIVREVDDMSSLTQAVVENLQRHDLNPLEEAAAYRQLLEDFELTHDELASRVGKSRSAISNTIRLLQLPSRVQRLVAERQLSAGHARALLACPDRAMQENLAHRAVEEGWSVRTVEQCVREEIAGGEPEPSPTSAIPTAPPTSGSPAKAARDRGGRSAVPAAVLELEELLAEQLATRVQIDLGATKGKVVIDFADLDDLERIYSRIRPH